MKIVIDISEEDYKRIQDIPDVFNSLTSRTYSAIRNGTPLPKGHGRLGDLDELEQRISNFVEHDAQITDDYIVARQRFIVDGIRDTLTIIKADRESEDEE